MKTLAQRLGAAGAMAALAGAFFIWTLGLAVMPAPTQPGPAHPAEADPADENWALRLVNGQNPLPESYAPETRAIAGYPNRALDVRAADALEAMLDAAQADGQPLYLVSAYRSVTYQKGLFNRKVSFYRNQGYGAALAEEMAAQWVARPGCSEHNLGLAVDLVSGDWYISNSDLTQAFADTPQFAWLTANAARYGFILRYPQGRESVTGVAYEPWHYRYVGAEAAADIQGRGVTLEEYLQLAA